MGDNTQNSVFTLDAMDVNKPCKNIDLSSIMKTEPKQTKVKSDKKTVTAVPPVIKGERYASELILDVRYEMKGRKTKTQPVIENHDDSEFQKDENKLPRYRQKRPLVKVTFGQIIARCCTEPQLTVAPHQRQRGYGGRRQRGRAARTPKQLPPNIDSEVEFPALK